MNERRNKYRQQNQIVENIKQRINVKFDITELGVLCSYVVSNNRSVSRSSLINIRKVLGLINMADYNNDEMINMINFINKAITARVDKNLTDMNMIAHDIIGGMGITDKSKIPSTHEINNYEAKWVVDNINSILMYSNLRANAQAGIDIMTKLLAENYTTKNDTLDEYIRWITESYNELRRIKDADVEEPEFSLERDNAINLVRDTYRELSAVSNTLKFGTMGLNNITGGGLHSKRVYILLGLPGEGKSSTLLDMALQIRKYNTNYVCKDPTKKPCVVLLTMENDIQETIERMFSMVTNRSIISCNNENDAIKLFDDANMIISDNNPINLVIVYKPSLSIDTSYLYDLIDRLNDEGYETMCIFQDYLKKIHSMTKIRGSGDDSVRLELGQIVLEFKNIATEKDIPIVTASQLNRDAIIHMDNAKSRNAADLVKGIGRGNIAESTLILENADWVCALAKEPSKTEPNITYLGMYRLKSRYHIKDEHAYYMQYVNEHSIKLIEDVGLPTPTFKTTLKPPEPRGYRVGNGIYEETEEDIERDRQGLFPNAVQINKVFTSADINTINNQNINKLLNIDTHNTKPLYGLLPISDFHKYISKIHDPIAKKMALESWAENAKIYMEQKKNKKYLYTILENTGKVSP